MIEDIIIASVNQDDEIVLTAHRKFSFKDDFRARSKVTELRDIPKAVRALAERMKNSDPRWGVSESAIERFVGEIETALIEA